MKAALILAAVLVAIPAQAKPFMCVLFPKQCIEPTAAPEPAPVPVAAPPPPAVVPAKPAAKPKAAKPIRVKPKYKPAPVKARRRAANVPSWCSWVPAGTSIARMQAEAKSRGIPWTAHAAAQARACLASKKG